MEITLGHTYRWHATTGYQSDMSIQLDLFE